MAANDSPPEKDNALFVSALTVIKRYSGSALDARNKGENHKCFVYEYMAEGAYRVWVEMATPVVYGKYSLKLLAEMGRRI